MTNTTNSKPNAKKPIFRKLQPGGISTAVFENVRDGRTYRSVNLQRSYRNDNQWSRMSMYLDHEHIPFVIEALEGTLQFLNGTLTNPVQNSDIENEPVEAIDPPFDTDEELAS